MYSHVSRVVFWHRNKEGKSSVDGSSDNALERYWDDLKANLSVPFEDRIRIRSELNRKNNSDNEGVDNPSGVVTVTDDETSAEGSISDINTQALISNLTEVSSEENSREAFEKPKEKEKLKPFWKNSATHRAKNNNMNNNNINTNHDDHQTDSRQKILPLQLYSSDLISNSKSRYEIASGLKKNVFDHYSTVPYDALQLAFMDPGFN
jgi:hypothetical protein